MIEIFRERQAMATLFGAYLVGDDEDHLTAVAEAVFDEIERVERVLSRHDRAAELYRVNRQAATAPVLVSRELFAVLTDCGRWFERTGGYFDVCAGSAGRFGDAVQLNSESRTVAFTAPGVRIDLGGYGKGYALDMAGDILAEFGVENYLLHGGTSSGLGRGTRAEGKPWVVAVRDCSYVSRIRGTGTILNKRGMSTAIGKVVDLTNLGMSTSAVAGPGQGEQDLIRPTDGEVLTAPVTCTVTAATATEAEVWSTALIVMGKDLAVRTGFPELKSVLWVDPAVEDSPCEWLLGGYDEIRSR